MSSETFIYKRGSNQQFVQSLNVFDPSLYSDVDLIYRAIDENGDFDPLTPLPVVIQCVALEGDEPRQSHSLLAIVERNHDNTFSLKPLKQKIFVDGLCYLLQEIYGIENKNVMRECYPQDDEIEDNSSECVICMSDARDTLILPCRHLCLCNGCADSLRYQANNCPICRAPFRALLQIKAVRKSTLGVGATTPPIPQHHHQLVSSNSTNDLSDIPPGYEPIPLIEALNGPLPQLHGVVTSRLEAHDTPRNHRKFFKAEHRTKRSDVVAPYVSTTEQGFTASTFSPSRNRNLSSPTTPG